MTHESTEMAPHAGVDSSGDRACGGSHPRPAPMSWPEVFSPGAQREPRFRVLAPNLIAASAFGSVHDLLNSTAFDVARNLVLFLAAVFWLGLACRVYRDARRRIDDPLLVGTATLLGLTVPYVGPAIYMLFRPPETLADLRARELELRALEEHLGQHAPYCPVCRVEIEDAFVVCPVCTTRLKQPCTQCSAPLETAWKACPYCAASTIAPVPELVTPDLDAALTAEVTAIGDARGGLKRLRKTRSASG